MLSRPHPRYGWLYLQPADWRVCLDRQIPARDATDPDAVVAIAKAAGFLISSEELKTAQAEVSEDELVGLIGAGNQQNGGFTVNIDKEGIGSFKSFFCFP